MFSNSRTGIPRILVLLNTNQHYTNLMPEEEDEFSKWGITTIVVQMANHNKPPHVKLVYLEK